MSEYYNARRSRNLFDPQSTEPFRVSRSKIDLFLRCPRCFYFDRRLGVAQPPPYPYSLNSAVDTLLKRECDRHRKAQTPHPYALSHGLRLVPFDHPKMDAWRDSLRRGIEYPLPGTSLVITGGVDDVWVDPESGELTIVDYKATSKTSPVTLDADWQIGYKRQAEIYQWLFRKNGFQVSDTAYFLYCNGKADAEGFDGRLQFEVSLLPYRGDPSWMDGALAKLWACLRADEIPAPSDECAHCQYVLALKAVGG